MKIKHLEIAISLIIIFFIVGCKSNKPDEKEIEQQAQKIAQRFDGKTIRLFEKWNFDMRGMWYRIIGDTVAYDCVYGSNNDSLILKVYLNKQQIFLSDFPGNYSIDTMQLTGLYFSRYKDEISVQGWRKGGDSHLLIKNIKSTALFKSADPFDTISKLYKLRDSLDFREATFRPKLGNFVEFYLYPHHVLTYLPDSINIPSGFKTVWISEFAKGKMIKKNWNLRKVKEDTN